MHVRVLSDYILTPEDRRVSVAFKAGWEGATRRAWGEALVAAGVAEEIPVPPRFDPLDRDRDGRRGGSPKGWKRKARGG